MTKQIMNAHPRAAKFADTLPHSLPAIGKWRCQLVSFRLSASVGKRGLLADLRQEHEGMDRELALATMALNALVHRGALEDTDGEQGGQRHCGLRRDARARGTVQRADGAPPR
jgi:hypothetical protein